MQTDPSSFAAPGAPGTESFWSRSAKDGVGTAYHTGCRVWFTLAHGIVTEVYCPTVDTPNTRDLEFLVTDGETFCHEEKRDLRHTIEVPETGALLYRLTNREPNGRYQLVKEVLADPHSSVLLVHTRLEIADHSLRGKLRLFALLAPHLGGYGAENRADWVDLGERALLHAEREDFHLMFGCDRGFSRRSVGYAGVSDGWQDLHKGNFQMDWQYRQAGPGSVALTGEIPLTEAESGGDGMECVLGLAFGDSAVSAAAKLLQSLATPFQKHREGYVAQWQRAALDPREEQTFAANTGDQGAIFRLSHRVLLAHEDKNFQGALIASLSTPWGESKTDKDAGGYHLVWTRDLVQSASALLATGEISTPLRALLWLMCIQNADGSFPQNSWIDGRPYWQGIQLDEMAAPLLLGWRLWKTDPEAYDRAQFRPVLRQAVSYLLTAGPVTAQDRWEENAGYSPSTLAAIIAAMCAAAEIARAKGHLDNADFVLAYADWLNAHVEDWCATRAGELVPGKPWHYVRVTPADPDAPDPHPDPDTSEVEIKNGGGTHPARRHRLGRLPAPGASGHPAGGRPARARLGGGVRRGVAARPAGRPLLAALSPRWVRPEARRQRLRRHGRGPLLAHPHRRARPLRTGRRTRSPALHPGDGTVCQRDGAAARAGVGRGRHPRAAPVARPAQRLGHAAVLEPRGVHFPRAFPARRAGVRPDRTGVPAVRRGWETRQRL